MFLTTFKFSKHYARSRRSGASWPFKDIEVRQWRDEINQATKGLFDEDAIDIILQELVRGNERATIYMFFDTEEELDDAFENRIVGDDNHDTHGYNGALGTIRCVTCNPEGAWQRENS